jgi:hypothetical protein
MGTSLGEEERWLGTPVIKNNSSLNHILSSAFRPTHPPSWNKDPSFWLSTIDIENVMNQYEESHGESQQFKFVGVFPRDFATRGSWTGECVSPPMCNLTVASLRANGKAQFGIVFNMDKHDQRGSHWTACYGCINPRKKSRFGIRYYDSVGRAPPSEVKTFMEAFARDVTHVLGAKVGSRFVVEHNRVRRQFGNTECGIFAVFFVVVCLTTSRSFDTICRKVMQSDKTMQRLRNVFFRHPATE